MEIINIKIEKPFRYLWLKSVIDVNLDNHCAKCLVGEYCSNINSSKKEFSNIKLNHGIYYLCGVSLPYNYDNNFHLAFKYQNNNILDFSNNGITVKIKNAVSLHISIKYVNESHPKSKFKSYYSCRNWQFANYFNDYLR